MRAEGDVVGDTAQGTTGGRGFSDSLGQSPVPLLFPFPALLPLPPLYCPPLSLAHHEEAAQQ